MKKVALYIRVSSGAQVETGHGLEGQRHDLRAHAEREGLHVVAEIADPARKRADMERPGLNELRELAAGGGIDEVWAWALDRYGDHPEVLAFELERMGVRLRALGDGGEDLGGEIMRAIGGVLSREEQRKRVKRSRMGKDTLAREGKIMGKPAPAYGYEFNADRDAYVVDPERMAHVRRVYRETADGYPIHAVVDGLRADGIVTRHGKHLSRVVVRRMVTSELYAPHTVTELRTLGVAGDVLRNLDPEGVYGVSYYGEIPVPVPDAGVPREAVIRARERLGRNRKSSGAGGRVWQLSGGVMRCAECGWRMSTTAVHRSSGKVHYYYRCAKAFGERTCSNRKTFNAETYEPEVWAAVRDATGDEELLRSAADAYLARERERLRPPANTVELGERLEEIATEREGVLRQNARGRIGDAECDGKVEVLDTEYEEIGTLLARAEYDVESLERQERAVEALYEHDAPGLDEMPPEKRVEHYGRVGLEALARPDGTLELTWFGGQPVASTERSRPRGFRLHTTYRATVDPHGARDVAATLEAA